MTTVAECRAYDPDNLGSWSDAQVQDALDSEASAQRQAVRANAILQSDVVEALKRRVQVNLAKRPLPLAVLQGDAEMGPVVPPGRDPEVRRLEGPYRKLVMG